MTRILDILNEYIDFGDGLDNWTRYALVGTNFIMILVILLLKRVRGKRVGETPPEDQQSKNILFVIAHPDDESMFFLPTIEELKDQGYLLHLLSFSNGGFDGKGKTRERELEKCCTHLGFEACEIVDDSDIQDGKDNVWPVDKMTDILKMYVEKHDIKGIFTFDERGISEHPNHIDVYRAVKLFKQKYTNTANTIKFFQLDTVNIMRKYIGFIDIIFSAIASHTFLNYNPLKAWRAMAIHNSQFVYYRKAFVIFSRYAYINTLSPLQ